VYIHLPKHQPISLAVYHDRVIPGWRPRLTVGSGQTFGGDPLKENFQIGWYVKNKVRKLLKKATCYPPGAIRLWGTSTNLPPTTFYGAFPSPTTAFSFVGPIGGPYRCLGSSDDIYGDEDEEKDREGDTTTELNTENRCALSEEDGWILDDDT
jgi:hypothetical protein